MLSLLTASRYEDGTGLSDADLIDELMTLLLAGHETIASALAYAFERLLRHPAALATLREEFATHEGAYLDAVIKETLRVRPIVFNAARMVTTPAEIAGHRISAGTYVFSSIAGCSGRRTATTTRATSARSGSRTADPRPTRGCRSAAVAGVVWARRWRYSR